jgi:hypothetical protein
MAIRPIRDVLTDRGVNWSDAEVTEVITWLCRQHADKLMGWAGAGIRHIIDSHWPVTFVRPDQLTVRNWAEDAIGDSLAALWKQGPKSKKRGIDYWNPRRNHLFGHEDVETVFLSSMHAIFFRAGARHARRQIGERVKRARAQREMPVSTDGVEPLSKTRAESIQKWIDRAGLTPHELEAINLIAMQRLSHPEAAQRSAFQPCSPPAMRARYHRAIKRLREVADREI